MLDVSTYLQGIVFSVRPPKKSWKHIANLSGGEKTLSSLSLVFALHHYKPTPLYVMDEIDAALDFKNVSIGKSLSLSLRWCLLGTYSKILVKGSSLLLCVIIYEMLVSVVDFKRVPTGKLMGQHTSSPTLFVLEAEQHMLTASAACFVR